MMYLLDAWLRYVLAVAVVGVTIWRPSWLPIVMAGEPSIHYINHPVRGDYLMAKDKGIKAHKKDTMDIITRNVSSCRSACWTYPMCVAAMAEAGEMGGTLCRMAWKGPDKFKVIDSPGSVYFYWADSLKIGEYVLRSDDLMYLEYTRTFNYTSTVRKCKKLPGHRLATAQQYSQYLAIAEIAKERGVTPWVGLTREMNNDPVWIDGTSFYSTEVADKVTLQYLTQDSEYFNEQENDEMTAFRFNNGTLEELPVWASANPLCQTNPLGVDWRLAGRKEEMKGGWKKG